jgi:hypothetical protein
MKRMRITGLCLVGLCLTAIFAFGAVTGASAAEILYQLSRGAFPATFVSSSTENQALERANGERFECARQIDLGTIGGNAGEGTKNAHLGKTTIKFTGCTALDGAISCQTGGSKEGEIEIKELVYHLGLADTKGVAPIPSELLLIPTGFSFKCSIVTEEVTGSVVGELLKTKGVVAKVGEKAKEDILDFKQNKGIEGLTEFLLSLTSTKQLMTGEHLLVNGEDLGLGSVDILKEYKNSSGETVEIELVNG